MRKATIIKSGIFRTGSVIIDDDEETTSYPIMAGTKVRVQELPDGRFNLTWTTGPIISSKRTEVVDYVEGMKK